MCARGELDHVAKETKRRFGRKNRFVLRLHFLENVGLNCAAQFRHDASDRNVVFAAAMYIAMMIGAGPLIVIDAEKSGEPRSNPS